MATPSRTPLVEVIGRVAANLERYRKRRMNEQDTKAACIDPIIESLGWDVRDPDVVRREFRPKGADDPVDYALQIDDRPRLLIEAKALGEPLDDRRFIKQTLGYAVMAGVPWCVLTDGDRWHLFNATAMVDADAKVFWQVKVSDPADNHRALGFLARTVVADGTLDACWADFCADRQVKAGLERLVAGPDKALIGLLLKECPAVPMANLVTSLKRLGIRVETPSPDPARVAAPARPRPEKEGRLPSLKDLFATGVLRAPLRLIKEYDGKTLAAVAHADGTVEVAGERHASLSTAGLVAVRAAGAPDRESVGGWEFWRIADGPHSRKTIGQVRKEA